MKNVKSLFICFFNSAKARRDSSGTEAFMFPIDSMILYIRAKDLLKCDHVVVVELSTRVYQRFLKFPYKDMSMLCPNENPFRVNLKIS